MNAPYLLQSAAKNVMPLKKDFRLVSKFLQGSDNTGQKKLNPVFHLEYVPDNEWPRAKSCPTKAYCVGRNLFHFHNGHQWGGYALRFVQTIPHQICYTTAFRLQHCDRRSSFLHGTPRQISGPIGGSARPYPGKTRLVSTKPTGSKWSRVII